MRTKARAIEGPTGEVLYSVTAIEDVTEVKRAEFANRLLARTGELLSHSADYRRTLERVPQLLVPEFADWCSVELPGARRDDRAGGDGPPRPGALRARSASSRERYPLRARRADRAIGAAMRDR